MDIENPTRWDTVSPPHISIITRNGDPMGYKNKKFMGHEEEKLHGVWFFFFFSSYVLLFLRDLETKHSNSYATYFYFSACV